MNKVLVDIIDDLHSIELSPKGWNYVATFLLVCTGIYWEYVVTMVISLRLLVLLHISQQPYFD